MSNRICCVPGCLNNAESKDVLHKFPNPAKDKKRFNTWVSSIGGDILGLSDDHIFKYRRVCHRHFYEKYWCRNNLLSKIAVPTRNMPGLSLPTFTFHERRPLQSNDNMPEASTTRDPGTLYSVPPGEVQNTEIHYIIDVKNNENYKTIIGTPELDTVASQSIVQNAIDTEMKLNHDPVTGTQNLDSATLHATDTLAQFTRDTEMKQNRKCKANITKIVRKRKLCTSVSQAEKSLRQKLVQLGIKLSKCRSKVKKQAVQIKALRNIVSHLLWGQQKQSTVDPYFLIGSV